MKVLALGGLMVTFGAFAVAGTTPVVSVHAADAIELGSPRCNTCSDKSTDKCKPKKDRKMQCFGSEDDCKKNGCQISAYSSTCSGAANIDRCDP